MWFRLPSWLKMMKTKRMCRPKDLKVRSHATFAMTIVLMLCVACSSTRIEHALKVADGLRGSQKYTEAEVSYKSVIDKFPAKPQIAQAYLHLGDLYFYNLKKNTEAIAQYTAVLDRWPLSPEGAAAYQHLAEVYLQEDRYDRVVEMNEKLIKYFPNHPSLFEFMHSVGAAYLKMKNYNQARFEMRRILDAKDVPSAVMTATLYDMGETYFLERNESQAIVYYKKLVEQFPRDTLVPMAKLQMAQCYEELHDMTNAVAIEKELRTQYPDDESIKAKLQQMEKRRRNMNRGPQMLPWDRKALLKKGGGQ